jgi:hypothetical protein
MRTLRTIFALFTLLIAAAAGRPVAAQQQVTPYGQQAIVMNAVTGPAVTPTGASATTCHPPVSAGNTCEIQSLGQNVHYLTYSTTGSGLAVDIRLEASFTNANGSYFPISADATSATQLGTSSAASGAICAVGYYPYIRANLVSFSGTGSPTLTALYSGTSAVSGCPKGTYNPAQDQTEIVFPSGSADSSSAMTINTPFANAFGTLFVSTSNLHSGGSISVLSSDPPNVGTSQISLAIQALDNSALKFYAVPLPPYPTRQLQVDFTSGGSSSGGFSAFVVFNTPPQPAGALGSHITTATNTAVKTTGSSSPISGDLYSVTINQIGTSTATATIYDGYISTGVCTGTVLAVLNVGSSIGTFWYNQQFFTGLCVTTTGATPADITVNYR